MSNWHLRALLTRARCGELIEIKMEDVQMSDLDKLAEAYALRPLGETERAVFHACSQAMRDEQFSQVLAAFNAFRAGHAVGAAEVAQLSERLEMVNSTNKLKQMTILELQAQRDALRAKAEKLVEALEEIEKDCTHWGTVRIGNLTNAALSAWRGEK